MLIRSPLKGRCVTIRYIGDHIVNEGQVVLDMLGGPVSPVSVQKTLVPTCMEKMITMATSVSLEAK